MTETTTTAIPTRMRHLGICSHPQTPYARRACRKAAIAALVVVEAAPTYKAGDEVDIDGTTIVLIARKAFSGSGQTRWSWCVPQADLFAETTKATAEDAIAYARRVLGGPRCSCGETCIDFCNAA